MVFGLKNVFCDGQCSGLLRLCRHLCVGPQVYVSRPYRLLRALPIGQRLFFRRPIGRKRVLQLYKGSHYKGHLRRHVVYTYPIGYGQPSNGLHTVIKLCLRGRKFPFRGKGLSIRPYRRLLPSKGEGHRATVFGEDSHPLGGVSFYREPRENRGVFRAFHPNRHLHA